MKNETIRKKADISEKIVKLHKKIKKLEKKISDLSYFKERQFERVNISVNGTYAAEFQDEEIAL